jgi:sentrin-specific protease 8
VFAPAAATKELAHPSMCGWSFSLPPYYSRHPKTYRRHIGNMANATVQQLSPEDAYLSYHDVRLTRGDVDTIKNDWLTDNVIAFWEEYLEHEKLFEYPKANIV